MESFCNYLIAEIRSEIKKNINYNKLIKREKYLLNSKWIRWIPNRKPKHIDMISLVNTIADSFIVSKRNNDGEYIVHIDPKRYLAGSRTKLSTVARFLDKGNESIKGIWFIFPVIRKYTVNMNKYWKAYASIKLKQFKVSEVVLIR